MAKGMPEIQQRSLTLFLLVGRNDFRLVLAGTCDSKHQCIRPTSQHIVEILLQPFQERQVAYQPVLDNLGQARSQFSVRQRGQNVGIGQHNFWLVKRADHVLSARVVDRGLATNGGVDLCKQGRRDLDERDASLVASSRKAGEIPDHATAKGNQCSGSITALFEQVVEYRIERFPVLKLLAVC